MWKWSFYLFMYPVSHHYVLGCWEQPQIALRYVSQSHPAEAAATTAAEGLRRGNRAPCADAEDPVLQAGARWGTEAPSMGFFNHGV